MRVDHILRKTGHMLVTRLVQLLLDVALHLLNHIVRPVIRVSPFSPANHRFVVVKHLFDLDHHMSVVAQIWEKLLDHR